MKHCLRILLIVIFVSASINIVHAQSFKDRYYQSIGYTLFLDLDFLPTYTEYDPLYPGYYVNIETPTCFSIISYSYKARVNLANINENSSVSIQSIPTLGFSVTGTGDNIWIGSFSIPLMIGYNLGNISTYETKQNKGFGVALGVEYFNGGLIKVSSSSYLSKNIKLAVVEPVAELSYRYWSKSNKAKEISLYVGYKGKGASDVNPDDPQLNGATVHGNVHVRLNWSTYIDY